MKKLLLSLSLCLCILLCGCENKKVCTIEEDDYTEKVIIRKDKDNEVVKFQIKRTYKDKEEAEEECEEFKDDAEDGLEVKCSGKTVTISTESRKFLKDEGMLNFYEIMAELVDADYKCN